MPKDQTHFLDIAFLENADFLNSIPGLESTVIRGTSIPDLPILATTLVHLEALLDADVVDLTALTNVVKSDLGLVTYLIRIASHAEWSSKKVPRIAETIVSLGIRQIKVLASKIPVLPTHPGNGVMFSHSRFWMHAQLTGLITEELASSCTDLNGEEAYLAGLLSQIGKLPILLGWRIPELANSEVTSLGGALARAWGFPDVLREVIDPSLRPTSNASQSLRKIVSAAREWVQLLEHVTDDGSRLR